MSTLVVGATGLVGRAICQGLRARGAPVRALSRSDSPTTRSLRDIGCAIASGDLKNRASVDSACRGTTTVITTANAILPHARGDSIESVDRRGSLSLVDAAKAAGASRFIYVSVSPQLPANNPFVQYKREVEAAVRSSGMRWTILQPTAFMEIHTGAAGGWDFVKARARIAGSGRAPASYISAIDVAAFAVESVLSPRAIDRALHIGGPEPISPLDAVGIAERVTGRTFKVQHVPLGVLRAVGTVAGPFNPGLASLLKLIVSLDRGELVDMGAIVRDLPVQQVTFEQYARRTVAGLAGVPTNA
jgi:NADH dehydrogenase